MDQTLAQILTKLYELQILVQNLQAENAQQQQALSTAREENGRLILALAAKDSENPDLLAAKDLLAEPVA